MIMMLKKFSTVFIITKTKCYEIQNEMRLGSQVIYQNEM